MKLSTHPLAQLTVSDPAVQPPMDQALILRLRVSLAGLLIRGDQFAATFYRMLFERYPALKQMFRTDMAQQRSKLAQSLAWIVMHLDRRAELVPTIRELGRRHAGYGAAPEHYPLVRDTLIDAMAITAGAEWSADLAEDWRISIDLIAHHMIAGAAATSTAAR
jgi:hemoglobin-like flavoprotein